MQSKIPDDAIVNLGAALNERQVARVIGVQAKTLRNWRVAGIGPHFVKVGRRLVRYRASDVSSWLEAGVRQSTSAGERSHG